MAGHPTAELQVHGSGRGAARRLGNSEVGHLNLGAGRIVYQDIMRINLAIEDGSLAANPELTALADSAIAATGRVHLMGLLSDGGVHSRC